MCAYMLLIKLTHTHPGGFPARSPARGISARACVSVRVSVGMCVCVCVCHSSSSLSFLHTHAPFCHSHLHIHDGFEDHSTGGLTRLPKRSLGRNFEGKLAGVCVCVCV